MNKRNTEGYVLAYLLIVIVVMGAIAATLMTSTVQVMAAQQNSIRYMQDKYAAMGEVERLVAEISNYSSSTDFNYSSRDTVSPSQPGALDSAIIDFSSDMLAHNFVSSRAYVSVPDDSETEDITKYIFYFSSTLEDDITIQYEISIPISITIRTHVETIRDGYIDSITGQYIPPETETTYAYSIDLTSDIAYTSYEITSNGGDI